MFSRKVSMALVEGTPWVETFEVVNSTFHEIAGAA